MKQPENLIKGKRYRITTSYIAGIFTGYHEDGSMYFMSNSGVVMIFPKDWKEITDIQEVE